MEEKKSKLKYKALYDRIVEEINSNIYKVGDKLPSESMLCKQFNISRQTVRNAFDELCEKGYIERRKGSGSFVKGIHTVEKINTIGVFFSYLSDYIFSPVIKGVEEVLGKRGYGIDLGFSHNKIENERRYLERMLAANAAGVIIEGVNSAFPNPNIKYYEQLRERGIPIVFIHNYYRDFPCPSILMNDKKCAYKMTKMLIDAGHEEIMGCFKYEDMQGHWRYQGFIEALMDHGIEVKEGNIFWFGQVNSQSDRVEDIYIEEFLLERIVDRLKICTAMVCYNDLMASHIIKRMPKGMTIPEDISVVGFDDSLIECGVGFGIVSAEHPKRKLGKKAAKELLKYIDGTTLDLNQTVPFMMPDIIRMRNSIKNLREV